MNRKARLIAVGIGVLAAVLGLLAGYLWGSQGSDSSPGLAAVVDRASALDHNGADGTFAMMMTEHHIQSVQIAQLAKDSRSEQVSALATKIEAGQADEIDLLANWMDAWGTSGDMTAMRETMPGAVSPSDMKALNATAGAAFDQEFLKLMVRSHNGAIEIARSELKHGRNSDALALAASIVISQKGEVEQMNRLID